MYFLRPVATREFDNLQTRRTSMTVGIPEGYDPYRAWLNIQEQRRPLNAYELLGVKTLEEDMEIIQMAAGQQQSRLRSHRDEARPDIWERLSGELEEAIATLSEPQRKNSYDASLRVRHDLNRPSESPRDTVLRTNLNGGIHCDGCGHENASVRKFCSNCGKNLWQPCFNCGTLCMSGETFCGACGANVIDGIEQRVTEHQEILRTADQMRTECRFDEAVGLLGPISRAAHPRLEEGARRAQTLIEQIARERALQAAETETALATAQDRLSACDYDGAIQILEQVPATLRNNGLAHLLDDARGKSQEVAALGGELAEAMRQGRTAHLLPKINQLLTLKPDHAQARRLAEQVRRRLCEAARQQLAEHRYEAAQKHLERIPKPACDNEVEELREQAAELAWIWWNLQNAPVIDKTLLNMATRLVKASPSDAQAHKLLGELQRRAGRSTSDPRRAVIPWAKPPEPTHIGCPVDWITGFERIRLAEGFDPSLLRKHPGCFFVAAGLALQGLGKTEAKVNLVPRDRSVIGRIGQLLQVRGPRNAWGLDLGSAGMKAVRLTLDPQNGAVLIDGCDYVEHRKLLSHAVNEHEELALVDETLRVFLGRNEAMADRTCLGLTNRMVLTRQFMMPPMDPAKLAAAIRYEAMRKVPFPLDELVWDYELLEHRHGENTARNEQSIMLIAAKQAPLKNRLARFEGAGIKIDLLNCNALALGNFVKYEYLAAEEDAERAPFGPQSAIAAFDVGCDETNLIVLGQDSLEISRSGFGSQNVTKSLVREFQLTFAQAEELKRNLAIAPSLSRVRKAIDPAFEEFVSDIRRMLTIVHKKNPNLKIDRMLGAGGGMQTHGLLRYLRLGK